MDAAALRQAARDRHLSVAIDGPAGAGKSTVGRGLAASLDCPYLDTGLMYRAVTALALRCGIPASDSACLEKIAADMTFRLDPSSVSGLLVNGEVAGDELRSPDVDAAVSEVSAHPQVRRVLVERQRDLARGHCIVMVGRDIGTVVLPDASVKLWVTASEEERAKRRRKERLGPGEDGAHQVQTEIRARDAYDSSRTDSPLRRSADAIVIETDRLTPGEALGRALEAVRGHVIHDLARPF